MRSKVSLGVSGKTPSGLTFARFGCAFVIAMTAAGCANLQAVNTAANQLVSTASSWDSVADEFSASCARRNQVSDMLSDCATERQTTAGLEAADKILSAYFTALQEASTSSNFSVTAGISSLSSSVLSIPHINPTQSQALSGLASFLVSAATEALEQRTVETLISNGAPKAEAAIDVLTNFVVPQLSNTFNREQSQTIGSFASYVQQSGAAVDLRSVDCAAGIATRSFPTGISYVLAQAYCSRINALATKRTALASYKTSLGTAKSTLMSLEAGKDNLSDKALAQQLISQASSLKDDVAKINKAF